jgi:hypothetical protein
MSPEFDGAFYWSNDGPEHVDLCSSCYPLVEQELRAGHWLGRSMSDTDTSIY